MASLLRRAASAYGLDDVRRYGRTAWLLTVGTLLLGIGRGIVAPFLVLFLVEQRGLALGLVGIGITIEFLVRAAMGPVAGGFSDRHGRKPLMLLGLASTSVILPSYLLVHEAWQFLALSIANGLFAAHSLYGPAANALVVDVVPRERRGGVFGLIHASRNLGWTIGILAGALAVSHGFALVFVGGALLPFAYLWVVAALVRDPPNLRAQERPSLFRDWGSVLARPHFRSYLVLSIPFYLGWGYFNTLFPLFVTSGLGLPEAALGILGLNTVLVFLLQIPFGRLADRDDRLWLLSLGALALAAGYAAHAWTHPGWSLLAVLGVLGIGVLLFTLAELLFTPILSAQGAELAPAGTTGSALGILGFSMAIGQGLPPLLADLLVPRWGWGSVWFALAAITVASAVGLLVLARRVRADARPAEGAHEAAPTT